MAQLKDSIVSGNLRVTDEVLADTVQANKIKAPTTSGGTTYGVGSNGQVLKSNGTSTYWGDDNNSGDVTGPSSATVNDIATFNNANGKVIKDSGYTFSSGSTDTTATHVVLCNDNRLSNSRTPTSHTHGNIQNGGTLQTTDVAIANGDKLVVTDASDSNKVARTSVAFDGSTATKCLTQKGTFESFGTSNLTLGTSSTTALKGDTKYAGSSSAGGAATSAEKLTNTSKIGDTNKPVYFTASGVPSAISYEINKSVPSDAVFTDVSGNNKLPLAGGTLTGRVTTTKTVNQIVTGTGTAAQDKGSGVSPRYFPAKWTFNTGLTATDGDIITIKIPVAGHDYGVFMSIDNGTNYYPIVCNSTGRLTTHYPVNNYITVIFEPGGSAVSMFPLNGGDARVTVTNGVWRVINYYDSNSDATGYYLRRIYPNIKAGSNKIFPYTLIMQLPDGRWESIVTSSSTGTSKARNTHGFLLTNVLLMNANATYNENVAVATYNIWHEHTGLIDHRYSFNTANDSTNGTTGYKPVYIVGSLGSDGLFYLDTKWWTQTLPSSEDGKLYIYIGDAYDYYRLTFVTTQKIYYYKQGAVREFAQHSATTDYAIGGMDPLCIPGTQVTAEGTEVYPAGNYSHVEGFKTTSYGSSSHAEGYSTYTIGFYSHAEGELTYSYGMSSHAEGEQTTSYGMRSHAEGAQTYSYGMRSHAEGSQTCSYGQYSHAEGVLTTAEGIYSHAEGGSDNSNPGGLSKGDGSHAEGRQTTSYGKYSHTEGSSTSSKGDGSHAEGFKTSSYGTLSHAEGYSTYTIGTYSHTEGNRSTSYGKYSHAEGGDSSTTFGGYSYGEGSHAEGACTTSYGDNSHAEGYITYSIANFSHAEGSASKSDAQYSHAEGGTGAANTGGTTKGLGSHAEGFKTTAVGMCSHAEGYSTSSLGDYSHAEGYKTSTLNHSSHAEGRETKTGANYAHAEGYATYALGYYSHAEGCLTTTQGDHSHSEGIGTIARGNDQHAEGKYNVEDLDNKYAHIIGNGADANNRKNILTVNWDGDVCANSYGPIVHNAITHRNVYRGKNLGSTVTTDQYNAIDAGTFEDLYIGDYWVMDYDGTNTVKFYIVDFDPYISKGSSGATATTKHHVMLFPSKPLPTQTRFTMEAPSTNNAGYKGCNFRLNVLPNIITKLNTWFGQDHILKHPEYLSIQAGTSGPGSGEVVNDCSAELFSVINIFGYQPVAEGSGRMTSYMNAGYTLDLSILPLFRYANLHKLLDDRNRFVFRDIENTENWMRYNLGNCQFSRISGTDENAYPYFLLCKSNT